jgi:AP2-like factor (euAP2 lineage)
MENGCRTAPRDGVRFIELPNGRYTMVDAEDYERVALHRWRVDNKGYVRAEIQRPNGSCRREALHRYVMAAPEGVVVHHRDSDKLNNCKSNLRIFPGHSAHQTHHRLTAAPHSKEGFKGVCYGPGRDRWSASIWLEKKRRSLGSYPTPEEAAIVYDAAVIAFFGAEAYTNLIPSGAGSDA